MWESFYAVFKMYFDFMILCKICFTSNNNSEYLWKLGGNGLFYVLKYFLTDILKYFLFGQVSNGLPYQKLEDSIKITY